MNISKTTGITEFFLCLEPTDITFHITKQSKFKELST